MGTTELNNNQGSAPTFGAALEGRGLSLGFSGRGGRSRDGPNTAKGRTREAKLTRGRPHINTTAQQGNEPENQRPPAERTSAHRPEKEKKPNPPRRTAWWNEGQSRE